MKTIILTRHAETIENKTGVWQGKKHIDFSADGKIGLEKLKIEIDQHDFELALSSDLPRCLKTTEYILPDRQNIIRLEPLIREKSSGEWAGQVINKELFDGLPGEYETKKPPGGENLIEVRERAEQFATLLKSLPEERILVVSHGGFLKIFFGMLLGKNIYDSIHDLTIDHCSLTVLELSDKGKFEFKEVNETKHL